MNKKVYLSNLEWVKTHDNMGGVKADIVFKDNMTYEEYEKLHENTYYVLTDTNLEAQWEEYQIYKQEKEMTLNKIAILKNKIENKYDIELVIKDINDIFNYFKENEVWQEYSEMYVLFMETYNTCLMANNRGGNNEK